MVDVAVDETYSEAGDATADNQNTLHWRKLGREVDTFVQDQFLADASKVDFGS